MRRAGQPLRQLGRRVAKRHLDLPLLQPFSQAEVDAFETCPDEEGTFEMRIIEEGASEMRLAEDGAFETRPAEDGAFETGSVQRLGV